MALGHPCHYKVLLLAAVEFQRAAQQRLNAGCTFTPDDEKGKRASSRDFAIRCSAYMQAERDLIAAISAAEIELNLIGSHS